MILTSSGSLLLLHFFLVCQGVKTIHICWTEEPMAGGSRGRPPPFQLPSAAKTWRSAGSLLKSFSPGSLTLQPADELMWNRALENAGSGSRRAARGCGVDKSRARRPGGRSPGCGAIKAQPAPSAPAARRAAPELLDRALPYKPALQSIPVFTVECTKCLPQLFSWFVSLVKCRVYHSFPEECALPTSSWKILSGSASWGAQAPWRLAESVQLISLLDSWYF